MPHLEDLAWNFKEELASSTRQVRGDGGTPEPTYYQYDGRGSGSERSPRTKLQPVTRRRGRTERVYLDGYELYARHSGRASGLERVSLSLMDEDHRFVIVETRNDVDDGTAATAGSLSTAQPPGFRQPRARRSGSAASSAARSITRTARRLIRRGTRRSGAAAKRYRFTGMERDEESGLAHHGARYYAPWLGRWLSCDPLCREAMGGKPQPNADREDGKDAGSKPDDSSDAGVERSSGRGARTSIDSARSHAPSRTQQRRPGALREGTAPDREGSADPKGPNPYAYVSNNPVVYRDPTGKVGIIQAWYDGYDSAGTGGKVGYGFLFIFAYLAHVIVNLIVLILAVTVLNPSGAFRCVGFHLGRTPERARIGGRDRPDAAGRRRQPTVGHGRQGRDACIHGHERRRHVARPGGPGRSWVHKLSARVRAHLAKHGAGSVLPAGHRHT